METTSATAASGVTAVGNVMPENAFARLLAFSPVMGAGVAPNVSARLLMPNGSDFLPISEGRHTMLAGHFNGIPLLSPIIGPGMQLQGYWTGGDAATIVIWKALWVQVPLGSVFYI